MTAGAAARTAGGTTWSAWSAAVTAATRPAARAVTAYGSRSGSITSSRPAARARPAAARTPPPADPPQAAPAPPPAPGVVAVAPTSALPNFDALAHKYI